MFDGPALAEGQIVGTGDIRGVAYGSDAGLYVEFRNEDMYQEFESERQGKPVYKTETFIRMYIPGDKTKVVDRLVRMTGTPDAPSDPERFTRQWNAFQAGARAVADGFPLKEWPIVTASQVRELAAINIHTLEQLAAVSDAALDGLGHGGRALRDKAKGRLEAMGQEAPLAKLAADNADLQRQLDELKASITNTRGPGRPKKDIDDAV